MYEVIYELTPQQKRQSVLWLSTFSFTVMFAVWLMFGILSVPIRKEFGLSDLQVSWLTALPVLTGAVLRLNFGILTDRFGGRNMMTALMVVTAIPVFLLTFAHSFTALLILAVFVGLAGNAFSIGVSWNSAWFPSEQQGMALGIFGAGNVGASITKMAAPALLAALPAIGGAVGTLGWRIVPLVYAILLVILAALVWLYSPNPDLKPAQGRSLKELLSPLSKVQVWRFALYYVVVFGAYVALSNWLPKYYVDHYSFSLQQAGLITALFIFPASLLRPLGGFLADKWGARGLMYFTFMLMLFACSVLALPLELPASTFTGLLLLIAVGMGIGKAAVFKFIPARYPKEVGTVGGLVGALGALGGFFLPLMFAYFKEITHAPQQTVFGILALFTVTALFWLHSSVTVLNRQGVQAA